MKIKALLYCVKANPILSEVEYLYGEEVKTKYACIQNTKKGNEYLEQMGLGEVLNGKIVIECDYEVDKILPINISEDDYDYGIPSKNIDLSKESCLDTYDICEYLEDYNGETIFKKGYAIHIKNVHIFDNPRELSEYIHPYIFCSNFSDNNFKKSFCRNVCSHNQDSERLNVWCDRHNNFLKPLTKAPRNMMRVADKQEQEFGGYSQGNEYILISTKPEEMCRIANKEQDVLIRRNVLKEMLQNGKNIL